VIGQAKDEPLALTLVHGTALLVGSDVMLRCPGCVSQPDWATSRPTYRPRRWMADDFPMRRGP